MKVVLKLILLAILTGVMIEISGCIGSSSQIYTDRKVKVPGGPSFLRMKEIQVPESPSFLTVSNDGRHLYVLTSEGKKVVAIDIKSEVIESIMILDYQASSVLASLDNKHIFTTSSGRKIQLFWGISKFSTTGISQTQPIYMEKGFFSVGGTFSPNGQKLYLSDINGIFLNVINPIEFKILKKFALRQSGGFGLAISPDGTRLYVTHAFNQSLTVIDTRSDEIIGNIEKVGELPVAVCISRDGRKAFVLDNLNLCITVIDTLMLKADAPKCLGKLSIFQKKGTIDKFSPYGYIYHLKKSDKLIIWNPYMPSPAVVYLKGQETIVHLLKYSASGIAIDPSGRWLFLSNEKDNKVTLFRIIK